jgi:hypothetical protein
VCDTPRDTAEAVLQTDLWYSSGKKNLQQKYFSPQENLLDYLWEDFNKTMAVLDLEAQRQFLIAQGISITDSEWAIINQDLWAGQTLHEKFLHFEEIVSNPKWEVISQTHWNRLSLDGKRALLVGTDFAVNNVKWAAATDFQKVSILDEAKNSYVESQQLVILEKALKDFRLIKRRALIVAKTIDYANLLLKRTDAVISSHLWGQLTQAQKSIFLEVRNISVEDSFLSHSVSFATHINH